MKGEDLMATYGYIRKDTKRTLMEQLTKFSPYDCKELFIEQEQLAEVRELRRCLQILDSRDTLVIMNLASFGKAFNSHFMTDLLINKTVRLISIDDELDTIDSPLFMSYNQLVSDTEKIISTELSKERERSRNGIKYGRPNIEEQIINEISYLYQKKNWSMRRIAEKCGVSLGTVSKYSKIKK